MGRQHQGVDRPGVRKIPEGSGEQGKMEETGCEIICGAPTTLAVKGLIMMMMMMMMYLISIRGYGHPGARSTIRHSHTTVPVAMGADQ